MLAASKHSLICKEPVYLPAGNLEEVYNVALKLVLELVAASANVGKITPVLSMTAALITCATVRSKVTFTASGLDTPTGTEADNLAGRKVNT